MLDISDCIFDEPATPIYLSGCVNEYTRQANRENLGLLVQPGNSLHLKIPEYPWWAADNGCYAQGDQFNQDRWLRWVDQLPRTAVFVVAPDVVGDWAGTIARSAPVLPVLQRMGFAAAFVAQDGLTVERVPWGSFDCLFIGGSTEWKLSDVVGELALEAKRRHCWVHVGRVNSWKRFYRAVHLHADSVDGTFLGYGPAKNWPQLEQWLERLEHYAATAPIGRPASHYNYGLRSEPLF